MRMRLSLLLVLAVIVALSAGTSSSTAAPLEPAAGRASDAGECAGPCPTFIYFKGNAGGKLESTPPLADFSCIAPACEALLPDEQTLGRPTVVLHPVPTLPNTEFARWEGCPPGGQQGADCEVPVNVAGAQYRLCVTFVVEGTQSPPLGCPPPYIPSPPPPPPPPPTGPPPLGSPCTMRGSAGPDVISGTAGRDVICGRGGNDVINGRGGHDLILGGTGADRVTGGSGRDHLRGDRGNDTFLARDGVRDRLYGGTGVDRARRDAIDLRSSVERRF